jgi:hypothetical protein
MKLENLIGKKFYRLTVIDVIPYNKKNRKLMCQCDCGNFTNVFYANIKSKETKSCGCLYKEKMAEQKKYNKYDLTKSYGIGYTLKGEEFYFDIEDYELIKNHCWHIGKYDGYVVTNIKGTNTLLKIHKLIMNDVENNNIIDHINRKPNDNRKSNLRIVTHRENCINSKKSSNNSSGITGISWCKDREKWEVYLGSRENRIRLGRFQNKKEAIKVRLEAELKYFGKDFAPQRHLFKEHGIGQD